MPLDSKKELKYPKQRSRRETILIFIAVVALVWAAAGAFLFNLGARSIASSSDEVVYVRVVQGILHDGAWFPLQHGKIPFFEKPPLKLWAGAFFPWMLGESNLSFRLLDGLCGLILTLGTAGFAYRLFRRPALALLCGFLLLGAPELVISHHGCRRAVLDGMLSVLTMAGAWCGWSVIERARASVNGLSAAIVCSVIFGLAALTKSVAGLIPLGVLCIVLWFELPRHMRMSRVLIVGSIGPCLFGAYIAILFSVSPRALDTFIGNEIVHRVVHGFAGHNVGDPFYFARYLFVRGGVVPVGLLVVGIVGAIAAARTDARLRFVFALGFVPVIVYSFASSRVPWYIVPYYPFIVITSVFGAEYLFARYVRKAMLFVPALACLLALTLPPYIRAMSRMFSFVQTDTERIAIDRLTDSLVTQDGPIYIVANAISGRSAPIRGKFNVEGIYRDMFRSRMSNVNSVRDVPTVPGTVAFVTDADRSTLDERWSELAILEPLPPRGEPVYVMTFVR